MTAFRRITFGILASGLLIGATWAQQPVVGQTAPAPPATEAAAYPLTPQAFPDAPTPPGAPSAYSLQLGQGFVPAARNSSNQISQLAQQYAKATKDEDKKELRKKLSEALGKQFDQLAERQKKELQDLEKQVADLKTLLNKRRDNRESIIDRRLEQVLQDAEGLGWSTPSTAPRAGGGGFGGFGGFGGSGGSPAPQRN
jgi:hypothetical protein